MDENLNPHQCPYCPELCYSGFLPEECFDCKDCEGYDMSGNYREELPLEETF